MITFVIFHVDASETAIKSSNILQVLHSQQVGYDRLLELAFRSILLFHSDSRIVLLTDYSTEIEFSPCITERVEIVRGEVNRAEIMFSRTQAELNYLQCHDGESHVIFMDSDMLVNGNFEKVFENEFDVALTYSQDQRETKKMPINGGLAIVHRNGRERAIQFFQKVHELYGAPHLEEYRLWWGDQYALVETIGRDNFFNRKSDFISVGDIKLLLLPCQTYNFSPKKKLIAIAKPLKSKKLLHFKGERKKFMTMYWQAYLAWKECPNIGARLQSLGAWGHLLKRALVNKN